MTREEWIDTLVEIGRYFETCRTNAKIGTKAHTKWTRYTDTIAQVVDMLRAQAREEDDGK